jgi:hypothetical protein
MAWFILSTTQSKTAPELIEVRWCGREVCVDIGQMLSVDSRV